MASNDESDDSGVGTTIVGGQPPGAPRRPLMKVPVGLERLLFAAASDEEFREELLRDREQAAASRGFPLLESERLMLRVAPEEMLRAAISRLDTSSGNVNRRRLLRAVAATVTIAAGGASGCEVTPVNSPLPSADMGISAQVDIAEPARPDFAVPFDPPDFTVVDIAEPLRPDLAVIPDMATPDLIDPDKRD